LNLSSKESLQWMDDFRTMGFEKKVKSFLEKFVLGKNSSGGTSWAALIKSQELSIAHLQPLPKPSCFTILSYSQKDALAENQSLQLLFHAE